MAQVFDVAAFDMIAMLRLPFVPGCVEWCFKVGPGESGGCRHVQGGQRAGGLLAGHLLPRCQPMASRWFIVTRPCFIASGLPTPPQTHHYNLNTHAHIEHAQWLTPLTTPHTPAPCCPRRAQRGDARAKLAVTDSGSGLIHIYDMRRQDSRRALGFAKGIPHALRRRRSEPARPARQLTQAATCLPFSPCPLQRLQRTARHAALPARRTSDRAALLGGHRLRGQLRRERWA
jgi:hypothetical protein